MRFLFAVVYGPAAHDIEYYDDFEAAKSGLITYTQEIDDTDFTPILRCLESDGRTEYKDANPPYLYDDCENTLYQVEE